ncbi:retropepsin-like domain-containing protein [Saprospiraceae bacterium]|nr:retropepsin-like domain-containing protein [Saprospiraceae bacterium]
MLLTLGLQQATAMEYSYKIPFVKSDGLMYIEAQVDGEVGYLIFDTGTDALILNSDVRSDQVSFHTIGGEVSMSEVKVEALSIGNFSFSNVDAYARDLSQLEGQPDIKLLGIIGAQLFSNELLHIDNDRNIIQIYSRSFLSNFNSNGYVSSSLTIVDDILIVPISISGTEYNFILDSGASTSFIDENLIDNHSDLFIPTTKSCQIITSDTQSQQCNITKLSKVNLAQLSILDIELGITDFKSMSTELDIQIHGILSLDQLPIKDVLIDFEASKVYIGI